MNMSLRQLWGFVGSLLALSWLAQVMILQYVGLPSSNAALPFMLILMLLPGIFGILYTLKFSAVRRAVQWKPKNIWPFIWAILLPTLIAFMVIAIIASTHLGSSDYFSFNPSGATINSGPWVLGVGQHGWFSLLSNVLLTMTAYGIISGLAAIGEEYGWRGVLQGAFIYHYGFGRGVAMLGSVWAIWHAPLILAGYNYPETPILGAFVLLPALLICASYLMAWLTLWNRSFWPAVLLHGAINSAYDSMISKISLSEPNPLHIPLIEIGLFLMITIVIISTTKYSRQTT